MIKFGTRLKQLRDARGWSQQVVADHLGMTQANYHKLESDKMQPKVETLEKLADFFDISLIDLLSSDRNTFNIQNNNHNHTGIAVGKSDTEKEELLMQQLKAKDEIIKLKDEKIERLQQDIEAIKRKS